MAPSKSTDDARGQIQAKRTIDALMVRVWPWLIPVLLAAVATLGNHIATDLLDRVNSSSNRLSLNEKLSAANSAELKHTVTGLGHVAEAHRKTSERVDRQDDRIRELEQVVAALNVFCRACKGSGP